MAAKKHKAGESKKPKESFLKMPYHILNIRELGLCEKVLLAHIYSFGAKGCWQSNATLAKILMVCPRSISKWIALLKKAKLIHIKSPKGYYRTLWAASHPEVKEAVWLWYRNQKIPNPGRATTSLCAKSSREGRTYVHTQCAQSRVRPGNMAPPTNNTTTTETTAETTAPPSPLPAGGQATAVLDERRKADRERIEQFKENFGLGRKMYKPLSEADFQNRRQQILAKLKA